MAIQEHVEQLNSSIVEWNQRRADIEGFRPNLVGANLRNANLHGADLHDADLRDAFLCNADLSDANLSDADLSGATLNDADLSGANLHGADFQKADLSRANLSNASLYEADLSVANMAKAIFADANLRDTYFCNSNLHSADLFRAELVRTDLSGANLRDADLTTASMRDAILNKANLNGTILYETVFSNTDLSDAKNLENCRHSGPSTIDFRTIEKSGVLPTKFLRGCGLPETIIEYLPSLLNESVSYYSCFISYSHSDNIFARRLHDQLQGRGIRCWLDAHQILPGDKIHDLIDQGIKHWDKVLLCASKESLSSWWVENEINKAFKKEQVLRKQRGQKVLSLIPLDLDGYLFNWEDGLADEIKSRYAPDFSGWEKNNNVFEQALERLVKALQADNSGRETPPVEKI